MIPKSWVLRETGMELETVYQTCVRCHLMVMPAIRVRRKHGARHNCDPKVAGKSEARGEKLHRYLRQKECISFGCISGRRIQRAS